WSSSAAKASATRRAWATTASASAVSHVPHIGPLLELRDRVGHVERHVAEHAADWRREADLLAVLALGDDLALVLVEHGVDEAAARAAQVVGDEELPAVLGDAAQLAAVQAARPLGDDAERVVHRAPPTRMGVRARARTSTPSAVGRISTSCEAAHRS